MRHRWTAACLLAAALGLPCRPAAAQVPDQAAAGRAAPHAKAHRRKAVARPAAASPAAVARPAAASPATAAQPLVATDGGSSLERRRRAFFAKPDEAGGTASDPTPPAGVTLGGSNGLTPGMGFKF